MKFWHFLGKFFEPGQVPEALVQAKMAHELSSSAIDEGMGSHPHLLPLHCIWSLQGVLYKPYLLPLEAGSVKDCEDPPL
jgi:hypothetical protein